MKDSSIVLTDQPVITYNGVMSGHMIKIKARTIIFKPSINQEETYTNYSAIEIYYNNKKQILNMYDQINLVGTNNVHSYRLPIVSLTESEVSTIETLNQRLIHLIQIYDGEVIDTHSEDEGLADKLTRVMEINQQIDYALDTRNEDLFMEYTKKLKEFSQ